ncbi:DUF3833 family protein [Sphingomonas bacterium]|uniref:DUF3833 family protein n=1 Tax=Sphingomonas bacterium TaxID=1895847 RepID=UPI0015765516|nr:DUF3833 family protein [Sphingomonas bacterium]
MIRLGLALALVASACATAADAFDPIAFFAGHSDGVGTLKVALSRRRGVHVAGEGQVERDGSLLLVQRIEQEGKPPRNRRWTLRRTGDKTYAGELSDAVGPVEGVVSGDVLRLRFTARGGLHIRQSLTLQPGGRVIRNRLVVRKFGVRMAVLDETIRKLD